MTKSEMLLASITGLVESSMDEDERVDLASKLLEMGAHLAYDCGVNLGAVRHNVEGVYSDLDSLMNITNPFDEYEPMEDN